MEAASLHRLAVLRARNKKFTESAELFRRAIALDPKNAVILCDFAQLYADRKDYEEAERLLKNALNLDPNNQKVLMNLGILIASQKNERETEGLRYLKLAVGEAEAYRELAKVYRRKGDVGRAEFAEQRAKLADNQPTPSTTLAAEDVSVRPPQPSAHQPQTPPEVVNRVRQELTDLETRKAIADTQRYTATPPVPRQPFIPAPTGTTSQEKIKVIPSETATVKTIPFPSIPNESPGRMVATQPPPPVDTPLDPFSPALTQEPSAVVPLPVAQTTTDQLGPLLVIQSSDRSKMLDTITFVRATEKKSTNSNSPEPQLLKISPAKTVEPKTDEGKQFPVTEELNRQMSVPPIRMLPNGENKVGRSEGNNPLRQIPPGGAGLIDPSTETPTIASLPSFSSVGGKKVSVINTQKGLPLVGYNAEVFMKLFFRFKFRLFLFFFYLA